MRVCYKSATHFSNREIKCTFAVNYSVNKLFLMFRDGLKSERVCFGGVESPWPFLSAAVLPTYSMRLNLVFIFQGFDVGFGNPSD